MFDGDREEHNSGKCTKIAPCKWLNRFIFTRAFQNAAEKETKRGGREGTNETWI